MIGKLLTKTVDVGMDYDLFKRDGFLLPPSPPVTHRSPEPCYQYSISPVRPGEDDEAELYADGNDDGSSANLNDPKLKFGKFKQGPASIITLSPSSSPTIQLHGRQVSTQLKIHLKTNKATTVAVEAGVKLPLGFIYGPGGRKCSLNNVMLPRRAGEGTTAIFDRPELKDSIRLRMDESHHRHLFVEQKVSLVQDLKKNDNNQTGIEQIMKVADNIFSPTSLKMPPPPPPPPPPQVLDLKFPRPPPPPVLKAVDVSRQRSRSSSNNKFGSTNGGGRPGENRKSTNSSSSFRGSRREPRRRHAHDVVVRISRRKKTLNKKSRRLSRDLNRGSRSPVRLDGVKPTAVLRVDWKGSHLPRIQRTRSPNLTAGLYKYFSNLGGGAKLTTIKTVTDRPRVSWLIYDTISDASTAKRLIEGLVEPVFTFHDTDKDIDYRIPYQVEFTSKCTW